MNAVKMCCGDNKLVKIFADTINMEGGKLELEGLQAIRTCTLVLSVSSFIVLHTVIYIHFHMYIHTHY